MGKIFKMVLFSLLFLTIFIINPTQTFAQNVLDCSNPNIQTDPSPLKDTDSHGEFIIDVDRTNFEQNALVEGKRIVAWKAEFECGGAGFRKEQRVTTADPGGRNIRAALDNSGTLTNRCEFDPKNSPISVLVKAVYDANGNGTFDDGTDTDTPNCRARYNVYAAASFCQLDISPKTGITVNSDVDVIVMDKASGRFYLVMDENVKLANDVQKGSTYRIPRDKMIQGSHKISLRKNKGTIHDPNVSPDLYGPSICPIQLTIGTLSNPGTATPVGSPGPGGTAIGGGTGTGAGPAGSPAAAGGEPCDPPDPNNPGFKTAIGCIHTSPAELVKDFMTFILGISGGLAFLMMLLGAFQMLTSAGNPETLATGKDRFTSAIIGLLFVIFAVLLLQIIGVDILRLPGFKR